LRTPRTTYVATGLALLCVAAAITGQAPAQSASYTVVSREGRRPLATVDLQGRPMAGLDDLAALFQLQVREDASARAVTVTFKDQTLVLTPDQPLVSASGRLVSLPAPLTRQGRRWLVPLEFISRAIAPIYDARIELRPASRLLIIGDIRVPRVIVRYDSTPSLLRVTFEMTPRAAASITQEPGHLLVRVDADLLDPSFPAAPTAQGVLTGIRVVEPNTIQLDLGQRFSSYRVSPTSSSGAASVLSVELVTAGPDSTAAPAPAAPGTPEPPAVSATPGAGGLPAFVGATRPTIRTIVIDAGHGGEDNGVKGPGGATEKSVTLAVARRMKAAIEGRLGVRVLLTHEDDNRVSGDVRVAMANNNKADLFISLHANGSPRPTTRGATVYTLSLDRSGENARRQSQVDREVLPVFGGGTRDFALVEWELAQATHLEGSSLFAGILEEKLRAMAGMPAVGLQRVPMWSLAGANMPAVLIEMGYLSNPEEEQLLTSSQFQGGIATALTEAVVAFRDHLERGAQPATP